MGKDRSGRTLENAVGRIQQMMEPNSNVSYRKKIKNRLGIYREFDVVIRGEYAGQSILGVIECKDWDDKVGTPELDAFITKSQDILANFRMIVSPKGFTKPALLQAKTAGVGVFSPLPDDPADTGFSLGVPWYARVYTWEDIQLGLRLVREEPLLESYKEGDILYCGKPVVHWFLKELSTTHGDETKIGSFLLRRVAR